MLPIIGLVRIERTTEDSHDYTRIISSVDQLTNGLLQLVTGSLAAYGTTPSPELRQSAIEGLRQSRAQLAVIEADVNDAERLGIEGAVAAQIANARLVLDPAGKYVTEIDGGATVATAPSTAVVVAGAGKLLDGQGAFTFAVGPTRLRIDQERRDTLRDAQVLLGGAVAIALVTLGSLLVLDNRRVHRVFALEASRRENAERLAAHRADVVNMASHELRNPLTALILSTQLIETAAEERSDAELTDLAGDAYTAALRCNSLVNELLDLGRLDADRLQLRTGITPLLPALHDAVAMSQAHHGAHQMHIAPDADISVNADPDRLRVILRNLVDNAFKYSPAGSPVFVTVAEWEGRVRIDIKDEGMGVPSEYRERIFQRFERVSSPEHVAGVGIGLYLSRELARKMDGDLQCTESDRGARFMLELPLSA